MSRIILLLLVILSVLGSPVSWAQEVRYSIDHFSVDDGLIDRRARAVLQHSDGFVYVGTAAGLSRFDGYTFKDIDLVTEERGALTLYISRLYELNDGRIAVFGNAVQGFDATDNVLLVVLDPADMRIDHFEEFRVDFAGLPDELIVGSDTIDVRTTEGKFGHLAGSDSFGNRLTYRVDENNDRSFSLELIEGATADLTEPILNTGSYATTYSKNLAEVIFIMTNNNGLVQISIDVRDFKRILATKVESWQYGLICRALYQHGKGSILIGSQDGLYEWLPATGEANKLEFKDVPGSKYLYESRGLHFIDSTHVLNVSNSGVTLLDLSNGTGEVLNAGLKLSSSDHSIELSTSQIAISAITTGGRSIIFIDPKSMESKTLHLASLGFNFRFIESVLFEDSRGMLFIGTTMGLLELDLKESRIVAYRTSTDEPIESQEIQISRNLSASHVISLNERDGKIWIGYYDSGIDILDPETDQVTHISAEQGLLNNSVCGLMPDERGMWIATFNGLAHYNPETATFSNFTTHNGLSHNEFNRWSGFISEDETYYLGTMNGVTAFNPTEILNRSHEPRIMLSEAGYYDRDGKTLITKTHGFGKPPRFQIPSTNRTCYVDLALSDFRNASSTAYSYRFVSDDREGRWQSNGTDRRIRFEYLPAGEYELQVRAVSANGVASADDLIIYLDVAEFFYLRPWFIGLCIVLIGGVMWGVYRYRLQQALRVERLRTRLSSDLHDDVGGLLSGCGVPNGTSGPHRGRKTQEARATCGGVKPKGYGAHA